MNTFEIDRPCQLLPFLFDALPASSRTTVKSFLRNRQVKVNGIPETRHDTQLMPGDRVNIVSGHTAPELKHPLLRIVYEDESLIVIDKRHGLLSMGTDKEQRRTAYFILSEHVKKQHPSNRIFIVHRLDRETSGLMLFAKNQQVQESFQRRWKELVADRRYVAVTEGCPAEAKGTIEASLTQNKACKVYVSEEGEKAVTEYRILKKGTDYALMELRLETGKKNQIRAHMEWKGCPIAGDVKYSARSNPAGRVCLHARVLRFRHPVTGENMDFSTRIPQLFESIV